MVVVGVSSSFVRSEVLVRRLTVNSVDRVAASRLFERSTVAWRLGSVMDTVGESASDKSGVDVHEDGLGTVILKKLINRTRRVPQESFDD